MAPRLSTRNTIDRFAFERPLWQRGMSRIAGVDEAGRGPLAGPVVAAAVVFPVSWGGAGLPNELNGLNDSKQLTVSQRERFYEFLKGCGEVEKGVASLDAG